MTFEERVIATVGGAIERKQQITLATNLINDLGVDSFGSIMIINALEDEFSITINETNFESVVTVEDIITLLRKYHPELEDAKGGS